ncbi:MAG: c-type cytochrome biogenesis protein CcmI [Alphaproteobacteria bacterium]|nr:c-type cytochrome biogenesis protein CcmI [Alphaproteobacteria bacterium]
MIGLWITIAVLTAVVLGLLLVPLARRGRAPAPTRAAYDITVYRDQLAEVDRDLERGLFGDDQAHAARIEIQRRMLAAGPEDGSGGTEEPARPRPRGSVAVIAAIAVAVPAGAVGLYLYLGSPGAPGQPFAERGTATAKADAGAGDREGLRAVVGRLAERLLRNPDDLNGWLLLARSYMTLEHYDDAANAFRRAMGLSDNRADIAAGYAEAVALGDGGPITPEVRQIFEGVFAAEPGNTKARYYLGLAKAQQGDVRGALQDWVDLRVLSPPDAPWHPVLEQQIERAARALDIDPATVEPSPGAVALAGARPPFRGTAPGAPPATSPAGPSRADREAATRMSDEERAAMIRSMVKRLAGRLEENPGDREGWFRLARAYEVLGEMEKAGEARARAEALKGKGAP